MDNDKIMKLILAPSQNMSAFIRMIEQQEKMAKVISPVMNINDSIQRIIKHHERQSKLSAKFEYPFTISDTIQKLINQSDRLSTSYNRYFEQLNRITNILNPSLSAFIKSNTDLTFKTKDSLSQIDLGLINSFEPIQQDYDTKTQKEIDKINECFENEVEFRTEVTELVNESTTELTTDIFLAVAQVVENYVGKINSRALALFLNFLFTTYCVLIPLQQIYLSDQSEKKIVYSIEKSGENIHDKIDKSKGELIKEINNLRNELISTKTKLDKVINDEIEKSNEHLKSLNEKVEYLTKRILDLEQEIESDRIN